MTFISRPGGVTVIQAELISFSAAIGDVAQGQFIQLNNLKSPIRGVFLSGMCQADVRMRVDLGGQASVHREKASCQVAAYTAQRDVYSQD